MFVVHDPVAGTEAIGALGSELVNRFCDAGVLVFREQRRLVSPFHLQFVENLIVLSDDLAHGGNTVFGCGPGTIALCHAIQKHERKAALDVGCGAGAVALQMAGFAHSVLATDINPRTLTFVELNATINGMKDIQTRISDLFENVNESFDLITMQLPFIPNPGAGNPAVHRLGGSRGNEFSLQAISELRPRLAVGGRSVMVFLQPIGSDREHAQREIEKRTRGALRNLLLLGPEINADSFSMRYASNESARGKEEIDNATVQMLGHLSRQGIRGLCPAVCISQPAVAGTGWTEKVEVADDLWGNISASAIDRLFTSLDLLHGPETEFLRARLRIFERALTFQRFTQDDTVYLAGPAGSLVAPLSLTRSEWVLLQSVHTAPNVGSVVQACDAGSPVTALHTISRALRAGVFDFGH